MIPAFIKGYQAAVDVAGYRIVTFADPANTSTVAAADAAADALVGISDALGADAGGMLDVHRAGLVSVQLGGTVQAGQPLTSDANGKAVAAAAAAATTVRIIGYADAPGVADDIIDCFVAPGVIHQG